MLVTASSVFFTLMVFQLTVVHWKLLLESQYSNYLIQLLFKYPNNSGLLKEETISKIYALIKSNEDFDILISL